MACPYLRPYPTPTIGDRRRQSVPEILRQQRIGVYLGLRNRHQHEMIRPGRLELPGLRVLAEPDQILASLRFKRELEQAFPQDRGRRDGAQRVPRWEGTSAHGLQQRQGIWGPRRPGELRLGLDQIHPGETKVGEIVA